MTLNLKHSVFVCSPFAFTTATSNSSSNATIWNLTLPSTSTNLLKKFAHMNGDLLFDCLIVPPQPAASTPLFLKGLKDQTVAGDGPWSSWRFYFLQEASILAMDRLG